MNLASQVEAFAALCLPDFTYSNEDSRELAFVELDIAPFFGETLPQPHAAVAMTTAQQSKPYAFTPWSRSQLLSLMGCREKWFGHVPKAQEVAELNQRLHVLRGFVLRSMASFDSPDLFILRGIVSSKYADIPDTDITKAVVELMPEGQALRSFSGKTDRALYIYAITNNPIGIPGTTFSGFPGIVIRNSEVGFTSLWVTPMMYMTSQRVPIIFRRHAVLRQIHRGDAGKLAERFAEALEKTSAVWGSLEERFSRLRTITYSTEDEAVEAMAKMLESVGAEKFFSLKCASAYKAAAHPSHDAFRVFEAVLGNVGNETSKDLAYDNAELAGAVLLHLIK